MSEAPPLDPDIALLDRLAAVDLAAVEHVHAQLLATTDAGALNDLGRTQERLGRSIRRTLLLKARLKREAADAAERQATLDRFRPPPSDPRDGPVIRRIGGLQDALARVGHADGVRGERGFADLYERLDVEIEDWTEHDDFTEADLDAQVRWLCDRLRLPADLAETWRDLPHPAEAEPPWDRPADEHHPPPEARTSDLTARPEPHRQSSA